MKTKKTKISQFNKKTLISFTLPTILYMSIFIVFPLIFSLYNAFRFWVVPRPDLGIYFVGFSNFWKILTSSAFHNALGNTLMFSFSFIIIEFILGLILALAINNLRKIEKFFTFLFILPTLMTPVIVALQWRYLLDTEYGIINWVLMKIGLISDNIIWLSQYPVVVLSIIIVDVWHWTPLFFLIILAGLKSIPLEPLEAAKIDGANEFQILLRLKIPMMRNVIIIGILIRFITSLIFFDEIYILTRGGPGTKTTTLSWLIYKIGFINWDIGKASAASWIFIIIVEVMVIIFLRLIAERKTNNNIK